MLNTRAWLPVALILVIAGGCASSIRDSVDIDGPIWIYAVHGVATPFGVIYLTRTETNTELPVTPEGEGVVQHNVGGVEIELRGVSPTDLSEATSAAQATAVILDNALSELWPDNPPEVAAGFTFATRNAQEGVWRVRWRGAPWRLEFSTPGSVTSINPADLAGLIGHEIYHLESIASGARRNSPLPPRSQRIVEEVGGFLIERCVKLSGGRPAGISSLPEIVITSNGTHTETAPFTDETTNLLAEMLRRGAMSDGSPPPYALHIGLNITVFNALSGGRSTVEPGTSEAGKFHDACRMAVEHPHRILPDLIMR